MNEQVEHPQSTMRPSRLILDATRRYSVRLYSPEILVTGSALNTEIVFLEIKVRWTISLVHTLIPLLSNRLGWWFSSSFLATQVS